MPNIVLVLGSYKQLSSFDLETAEFQQLLNWFLDGVSFVAQFVK